MVDHDLDAWGRNVRTTRTTHYPADPAPGSQNHTFDVDMEGVTEVSTVDRRFDAFGRLVWSRTVDPIETRRVMFAYEAGEIISSVRLGACGAERASESWINPHSGPGPGTGEPTWDSNPACGPYVASQYGEFRVTDTNLLGQTVISNREFDSSGQPIGAEEDENHELIKVQALTFYSRDFTPWGTVATDGYDTNGLIADGLGYSNWYVTEGDVVVGGETIEGFAEIEEPYTGPMIYYNGGGSSGAPVMAETPPPCDEDAYWELKKILDEVWETMVQAQAVENKAREKWGAETGVAGAWNEFMHDASSKAMQEVRAALSAVQTAQYIVRSVLKDIEALLENCPGWKEQLDQIKKMIADARAGMTARADQIQDLNEQLVDQEILFDFLELAVKEGTATLFGVGLLRRLGRLAGLAKKSKGVTKRSRTRGSKNGKTGPCFVAGTLIATLASPVPIEDVRVGDRVLTTDTAEVPTEVDPETWQLLRLEIENPEVPGDHLEIVALRSPEWVAEKGAVLGATFQFQLDEWALAGTARVVSVEPCPVVKPGRGRVVLTTVTHRSRSVYELQLADGTSLRPTAGQRLFSVAAQSWIPTRELIVGDQLRTRAGPVAIVAIARESRLQRVFNLEVETDHCYFAGEAEVLSHNTNECAEGGGGASSGGQGSGGRPALKGDDYHADEVAKRKAHRRTRQGSPQWNATEPHKGKTRRSGTGRDRQYYEWDNTHGDIEVYNRRGEHLGSMDPVSGEMIKPAVRGRKIDI